MRSRTVRPIQRRNQKKKIRKSGNLGDTQPMRPVGNSGGSDYVRAGYEGYQRSVERRRKVVQAPVRAQNGAAARPARARRSDLGSLIVRLRRKPAAKVQYFDYDMLLVIIFLMCFGLVMLYSTSAYEAQADFGNDLYYFTRQALIGVVGFVVMLIVSRIDYHIYGAFAVEIFVISMVLMALVQTPLIATPSGV